MRNLLSTTALIAPFLVSAALAQDAPATDQNDQTDPQAEELVEDLPDTEPENDDEDDDAPDPDETELETEVEATETGIETDPDLDTDAEVETESDLDIETETDPATDMETDPGAEDTLEAEPVDEPVVDAPVGETDPADPDAGADADMPAFGQDEAADEAPVDEAIVREQAPNELRVDWITGSRVNSYDGENIGRITDLIFDEESHRITVAILSVGGFLGIGAKDIAVKFEELTIDYDAREIQLNLTRDAADAAPEYVFRQRAERPVEEPVADPMDDPAPAAPMD